MLHSLHASLSDWLQKKKDSSSYSSSSPSSSSSSHLYVIVTFPKGKYWQSHAENWDTRHLSTSISSNYAQKYFVLARGCRKFHSVQSHSACYMNMLHIHLEDGARPALHKLVKNFIVMRVQFCDCYVCSVLCIRCTVVCKCELYRCHRVSTQLQLNIYHIISRTYFIGG